MSNNAAPIEKSEQQVLSQSFDKDFNQLAIEQLGYDPTANALRRITVDPIGNIAKSNLSLQFDYVGGTNPIYIGTASPGSATSASVWQIKKMTYDANNNVTSLLYAGGTTNFNQVWDNRASLAYS